MIRVAHGTSSVIEIDLKRPDWIPDPRAIWDTAAFNAINLGDCLKEYFRTVHHPHVIEVQCKYPGLARNEGVMSRLHARYPSRRMTDKEYQEMWTRHLYTEDSFITKIAKNTSFYGKSYPIPFGKRL